jgi:hypothetical protein
MGIFAKTTVFQSKTFGLIGHFVFKTKSILETFRYIIKAYFESTRTDAHQYNKFIFIQDDVVWTIFTLIKKGLKIRK